MGSSKKEQLDPDEYEQVIIRNATHLHSFENAYHKKTSWIHDKNSRKVIIMGTMTFVYCLAELIVGVIINSVALMADSFHMISDFLSLIIGFVALQYAQKNSTSSMSYGFARAEIIGGMFNGVFLACVGLFIVLEAFQRFMEIADDDGLVSDALLLIGVASGGLLFNIIGLFVFHDDSGLGHAGHSHGGHSHGHGDEHKHEHEHEHDSEEEDVEAGKKPKKLVNINMHGIFLHVLGDALGSVAAVSTGIIIKFASGKWRYYSDPVASLIVALIVLRSSFPLIKTCVKVLMQRTPESIDIVELKNELSEIEGARHIHDLHVWQLGNGHFVGTLHVECSKDTDFMDLAIKLKRVLHRRNVHSTTIQPEFSDKEHAECVLDCDWKKNKGEELCSLLKNSEIDVSSENNDHAHVHTHDHSHANATKASTEPKTKKKSSKKKTKKKQPKSELETEQNVDQQNEKDAVPPSTSSQENVI